MNLYSIGYEKRPIDEFCQTLASEGVTRLVDVRRRAWSHRPEYRKTALAEALEEHGIAYVHCKEAGNPYRPRSHEQRDIDECKDQYTRHLADNPGVMDAVHEAIAGEPAALFCYEGHRSRCHRGVLFDELQSHTPELNVIELDRAHVQRMGYHSREHARQALEDDMTDAKPKKKRSAKKKATKKKTAKKATRKAGRKKKASTSKQRKQASTQKKRPRSSLRGTQAPGWVHTSPEVILAFRKQHDLSEPAAAEILGASTSSIRNWTKGGKVASLPKQEEVAQAMADYHGGAPSEVSRATRRPSRPGKTTPGNHLGPAIELLERAIAQQDLAYAEAALVLLKARGST